MTQLLHINPNEVKFEEVGRLDIISSLTQKCQLIIIQEQTRVPDVTNFRLTYKASPISTIEKYSVKCARARNYEQMILLDAFRVSLRHAFPRSITHM